jgi:glycosyltransferase involved in cell wall biosynthesis
MKIRAIIPRYGAEIGGGAETLMRSLMIDLHSRGEEIEIWTTTARDHRTWENYYPEGVTVEDGFKVRRFSVRSRNLDRFIELEIKLSSLGKLSLDEQLDWQANGVNSDSLYEHIQRFGADCDLLLFAPYLFPTSFWGALIHPEKSMLIPCLHDEQYAYLEIYSYLFNAVRGLIFNSAPEQALAESIYGNLGYKSSVVGMTFAPVEVPAKYANPNKPDRKPDRGYLLYSGRKEQGKNLGLLLDYYSYYREIVGEEAIDLVLIGAGEVDWRELPAGVIDRGFVSAEEKTKLMRDALVLIQPSQNESFSIVLMEAWLQGTPVLVHGGCAVTKYHVEKSGGGLYFENPFQFTEEIRLLTTKKELACRLGENGRNYVLTEYNQERVLDRFYQAIQTNEYSVDANLS